MTAPSVSQPRPHWPSILQLGLSLFAALTVWSAAAGALVIGVIGLVNDGDFATAQTSGMQAAGLVLLGALAIPSAAYSLLRLSGRTPIAAPRLRRWLNPGFFILLFPFVALAGHWAVQQANAIGLLIAPLHLVALGLPVWWLLWVGRRGLPAGSPQRDWGAFNTGLLLTPLIVLLLELVAMLGIIFTAALYVYQNPALRAAVEQLAGRVSIATPSPEVLQHLAEPLLSDPVLIGLALVLLSLVVPLIEELFKPLGVWLLAGRGLTGAQGFTLGLLSGAGYALAENIGLAAASQDWALQVTARIGTSAMHLITSGLMGWAIAKAVTEKRYLRLAAAYAVAVSLHGLWNGMVVMTAVGALSPYGYWVVIGPFVVFLLAAGAFTLLLAFNRSLRREMIQAASLQDAAAESST